jgi:SAM-dependent methyltransferase
VTSHPSPAHHHDESHGWSWAERGQDLLDEGQVFAPLVEQAVAWLAGLLPHARTILDVGSGPGVAACTFLETWPHAQVLAVDGAEPLLGMARDRADHAGLGDRLSTQVVALPEDLPALPPADLVWVSGVLHHMPDLVTALRSLGALVREGGLLAVREGGLPLRFLPEGRAPGLFSRVETAAQALTSAGQHPAGVVTPPVGWPTLIERAGLANAGTRSFLLDRPAPADERTRTWLLRRLTSERDFVGEHLDAADAAVLDRLADPAAPDGILHDPEIFLLTASTLFTARPADRRGTAPTAADRDSRAPR